MRVITGTARGRKLKELRGYDTRPTTDRVKESIFNIIQFDIEGRRVLDLFSGTGQMGIECLSRGAAHCVFVDQRREAAALVRENLTHTALTDRGRVVQGDALAFLHGCREKFDLIFLDPPYAGDMLQNALKTIAAIDIVTGNGIIICESTREAELPVLSAPYGQARTYRYGNTSVALYRRAAP
ncbi:MAG: 16S rRNA (guanine(966)-N(2))-methyltransferase RsmD [Clostridiales bacterium]|nr:16S rRNA (guanine(966)-N(2))-methyltransferase RsmD [Clostridiales bacterium]